MALKEQTISPILIAAALIGSLFFQGRNLYVFLAVQAALVCALTYRLMRAQAETVLLKIDFMSGEPSIPAFPEINSLIILAVYKWAGPSIVKKHLYKNKGSRLMISNK